MKANSPLTKVVPRVLIMQGKVWIIKFNFFWDSFFDGSHLRNFLPTQIHFFMFYDVYLVYFIDYVKYIGYLIFYWMVVTLV